MIIFFKWGFSYCILCSGHYLTFFLTFFFQILNWEGIQKFHLCKTKQLKSPGEPTRHCYYSSNLFSILKLLSSKGCCAAIEDFRSWDQTVLAWQRVPYYVILCQSWFTINFRSPLWTPSFCKVFWSVTQIGERTFNGMAHPIKFTWPHKRWRAVFFKCRLRQISYRVSVNVCWKEQREP